jgi:lipid II:glycine glycyltransferase (peptidoglycan interpeptide bridge formation enzyme)
VREEIAKIHYDYEGKRGNIFFQRWIINEILRFYNISHRSPDFWPGMRKTRQKVEQRLYDETGLIPSFRENMPLATIIIDTDKDDKTLLQEMNSWAKNHVRKSLNNDITFRIAEVSDYEIFYEERFKVSGVKWFNIIKKSTYSALIDYLTTNKCGNIFIATKDNIILWGSIAVYDRDTITYLYGFSNRNPKYRNIGVHQFIKFQMFQRAREHNIQHMDLFGGAPTWFSEHPLTSVSQFKESLWWKKIERYGNFDIVFNPTIYSIMRYYYMHKV